MDANVIKESFEQKYALELDALKQHDQSERPANWQLSPKAVRTFILGSKTPLKLDGQDVVISKKFFGNDALVERAIVTLASNRALMLIGEPGTAKSYLSELLSAAICNNSTNTIQGSIGLTEDMIKYSWNYALLIAKGPILDALVGAPIYRGMTEGIITRFEEITRATLEIQDSLISILSDKILNIPELKDRSYVQAKPGFNVIATANTRDKGVNEMSSALKRRFNFETIQPLQNIDLEKEVITKECSDFLKDLPSSLIDPNITLLLATTFNELRQGQLSTDNVFFDKPSSVMSTAEAVNVYQQTAIDAHYYNDNKINIKTLASNILTSVVKDQNDDLKVLKNYAKLISKHRKDSLSKELAKAILGQI